MFKNIGEEKKRYKMYKAGKKWIVAPIVFFSLLGSSGLTSIVSAAETNTAPIEVVQETEKADSVSPSKETAESTDKYVSNENIAQENDITESVENAEESEESTAVEENVTDVEKSANAENTKALADEEKATEKAPEVANEPVKEEVKASDKDKAAETTPKAEKVEIKQVAQEKAAVVTQVNDAPKEKEFSTVDKEMIPGYFTIKKKDGSIQYMFFQKFVDKDGNIGYCLDSEKKTPDKGQSLPLVGEANQQFKRLFEQALNNVNGDYKKLGAQSLNEAYYAGQFVGWMVSHGYTLDQVLFDDGNSNGYYSQAEINRVKGIFLKIYDHAVNGPAVEDVSFTLNQKGQSQNETHHIFTFETNSNKNGKFNLDFLENLDGVIITDKDGHVIGTKDINNNSLFNILIPFNLKSGSLAFNVSSESKVFKPFTYSGQKLGIQDAIVYLNTNVITNQSGLSISWNKPTGELIVKKTDEKGKALAGAEFGLYDKDGNLIGKAISDKDGTIRFTDIEYGSDYEIRELNAPKGYVNKGEKQTFSILKDGEIVHKEFINQPILGKVVITKTDSVDQNKKLAGARFEILDENGNVVATGITNENGEAIFDQLRAGKYTFREIGAPSGYTLNGETFAFEILEDGTVLRYVVKNDKVPEKPEKPTQPKEEIKETKVEIKKASIAQLPQTGEESNSLLIVAGGLIAALGLAGFNWKKKKAE